MFEHESDIVRKDILILKGLLAEVDEENIDYDIFKIEMLLNAALDHIEFLHNNLPLENNPDGIEDEVVECETLMEKANDLVEQCKVAYHIENCFFRDHVTPEFHTQARSIIDKSRWKKEPQYSFTASLIACIVLMLIFGLIFFIISLFIR